MFEIADRIREIQAKGEKVIDLSLGQPEVPAPGHITEAIKMSLDHPITSYTAAAGSLELRSIISEKFTKDTQAKTDRSEVIVTCGSKHALFITLLSLVDPGEEILVPEPYFPAYAEITALIGGKLSTVEAAHSEKDLRVDVEELLSAVNKKTKVILLNYPNNPGGWTLSFDQVRRIADFCSENEIYLVSDEIYNKIVFDEKVHASAWSFSKDSDYIVSLGSFSKTYSMVPFRLGYVVARRGICDSILKAQRGTITMVSPYIQNGGIAALKGPQDFVAHRMKKYQQRRDKCIEMLRKAGINSPKPEGAFYLFIKLPNSSEASKFAINLLDHDRVAVLPGSIFGPKWKSYVRISFATEDSDLYAGLSKFQDAFPSF